ncbi:LPS export ABC transporter permease LptG [Novosphingobium sp. Chol11]|uniref:LPS export ABC transporter permease LptG n=1 Tax=Novosphingobium sp. Chol11 TaxID=1385763 RepID=UPI0025D64E52|nr:LPS export ABC transporter permease LptG [Novosphingobium sp. Chol11]
MGFDVFPSRVVTWYIGKMFAVRILAVLVLLVLVLQALDLLSESGKILAPPGNGQAELLTYASMRIPQLISRFLPYSVLLATIVTLMTLNQNSEVISLKAAGMSAVQILAPLFLVSFVVSLATLGFNERFVTRSTATLKAWQAAEYGLLPSAGIVKTNLWLQDGANIMFASAVEGQGDQTRLIGVTWYRRNPSGMVSDIVRSPLATFARPGWRFADPVSFEVQSARIERSATPRIYATGVAPSQVLIRKADPEAESLPALSRSIAAMQEAGSRTSELEGKWWHKLSGPLSALLMPLLGAVAGFGLARSGQLFIRAVIGMALGFAYFVVDNAALAVGSFGGYPPFLSAWGPFFLFLLIGTTVLLRTEE